MCVFVYVCMCVFLYVCMCVCVCVCACVYKESTNISICTRGKKKGKKKKKVINKPTKISSWKTSVNVTIEDRKSEIEQHQNNQSK